MFPNRTRSIHHVWNDALGTAARVRSVTANIKARSLAGNITGDEIVSYYETLGTARAQLIAIRDAVAASSGFLALIREQLDDPTRDIGADFNAMLTAVDNTLAWIEANIPASGGYLLIESLAAGARVARTFTAAATAAFRTQLDALLATIEA